MYFHKLNLNRISYIKFVKCGERMWTGVDSDTELHKAEPNA